ncbi:hypothetical protein EMPS_06651 [Entomortierella parvispora]|uniref:Uncharacterized protein n=1 Tax=Entomortierella parvispora TaxID=205924 RepID=A0A9P3HD41_9FUNG|nr:hypothetical protein EMPS_06651 [Entomortierella parvispora]
MADNSIMDETFDFSELSLEEPGDQMAGLIEQSLQLNEPHSAIPSYSSEEREQQQNDLFKIEEQTASGTGGPGDTIVDNGPWAKIPPSSSRIVDPYQPGITAQKLDAMAADPHHVFRSSQTPFPFPFTVPPSPPLNASPTTAANGVTSGSSVPPTPSTSTSSSRGATLSKDSQSDEKDLANDKIPAWMLEDPKLVPNWTPTTVTHDQTADEDWASLQDRSTTVDSAALFGFTSFPSYESLSIANAISEEQHRRQSNDDGDQDNLLPEAEPAGGFARYGEQGPQSLLGQHEQGSLFAGAKQQFTRRESSSLPQLQEWRTGSAGQGQTTSRMEVDDDMDDFFVEEEDESPVIKASSGFAPAQFHHNMED